MNFRTLLLLLFIIAGSFFPVYGQFKDAEKEMDLYNYSKAIDILLKTLKKEDQKSRYKATLLLGECYRRQNDMLKAKEWYEKAVESGHSESMTIFFYAQSLRSAGDYSRAKKMFSLYDSLAPGNMNGKIYSGFCDSAIAWKNKKPLFEIKNASALNSRQSEFGPVFYGKGIIFTSDRIPDVPEQKKYGWTGNNYLRIYYAEPVNADSCCICFSKPELLTGIFNREWHDGPVSFNGTNDEVYINRTLLYKDKGKKDPGRIRTHLLKIFTATKKEGKWTQPEPFVLNSDEYSVGHPALTPGGDTLYFVSDKEGGSGGTDIYFIAYNGSNWSQPVNLGNTVNTPGNEMFPFITGNGYLYFASDGLPGFGGLDLFVTHRVNGKWVTPRNLGQPINSSFDDFSLTTDKTGGMGYFSSNRPGGSGEDDIYCFSAIPSWPEIPVPLITTAFVTGCVKDKTTKEPIPDATVFKLGDSSGQVLVIRTDQNGCFRSPVIQGKRYQFKATKGEYIPDCLAFSFEPGNHPEELRLSRDLLLDRLELDKAYRLENIYYNFDKWDIRPDAESSLNNLVRIMKENPLIAELGSHTDCRGSEEYNLILSQKRAESAVRYIIQQGIDAKRITAKGYGKSRLVNHCDCSRSMNCNEAEHQANRRTEFRITGWLTGQGTTSFNPDLFNSGASIGISVFPAGFFSDCGN